MLITVCDRGLGRIILRWAWGPRRRTSSNRYGELAADYPAKVTAATGLWWMWLREGTLQSLRGQVRIVIAPSRANARVQEALTGLVETRTLAPDDALPPAEIERLQACRRQLRQERRFAEADEIRALSGAHGVDVHDAALETSP